MTTRWRKFIYIFEKNTKKIYNMLQTLPCKYHIITKCNDEIHGFIYFAEATSVEAIQIKIKNENVYSIDSGCNYSDIIEELKEKGRYWETGSIRKYKKEHKASNTNRDIDIDTDTSDSNNALITTLVKAVTDNNTYLKEQNSQLITTNNELQKSLVEKSASVVPMTINNSMTNSNNDNSKNKKITNINVFLNTECKDAITLRDFVSKLVVTDDDLECMKHLGYVESVTRLLKRSLNEYELTERPIHCTDVKREVMHVKDQEGWKKETSAGESPNIDKAFKQLTHIHRRKMTDTYRDVEPESKEFEEKAKVMYQIASSGGTEEEKYKKKIIKNISDEIRLSN
jgi:hypothetical protein